MSPRSPLVAIAALGCISLFGCSGSGPVTVPVYGTVTFAGREAPKVCNLYFQPVEVQGVTRPATCQMSADGKYAVKAFQHSKGLVPGTYHVRVAYYDLKPGANPSLDSSWREAIYDAGDVVVDAGSSGIEHNIEVRKKT